MSKEVAHQKRVQAALSTVAATAGLSALATKGGAAAARRLAKPAVANRLALKPTVVETLPKAAEHMDKFSLGALTTGAGVGGAGGLHFAALQRAEAKQQEKGTAAVGKSAFGIVHISKAVYDLETKRNEAAAKYQRTLGQRNEKKALEQGRFLKYGEEREHVPHVTMVKSTDEHGQDWYNPKVVHRPTDRKIPDTTPPPPPQRRMKAPVRPLLRVTRKPQDFGGINPEAKRQRHSQAAEGALAGVGGATIATAGGMEARNLTLDSRKAKLTLKSTAASSRAEDYMKLKNRAKKRDEIWRGQSRKSNRLLAAQPHNATYWERQIDRQDNAARRAARTMNNAHKRAEKLRATATQHSAKAASLKPISHGRTGALAGAGLLAVGGAAAVHHSRDKGQGRKYTDWWDG